VDPEGFVPWGNKRDAPSANFDDDDFPALGGLPTPTPSFGRGAGRGLIKQEKEDNFALGMFSSVTYYCTQHKSMYTVLSVDYFVTPFPGNGKYDY